MKTFVEICKMKQTTLKEYAETELKNNGYKVVNEDGFLYAKGTYPVLLVAHMDTVHKQQIERVVYKQKGNILSSPQGIGGDDRCGIYMILSIIQKYHCSVLFTEDEEQGGIGARKFCDTDYVKNLGVDYMIELDRMNANDAVFYQNGNKEFQKWICDETIGFKKSHGSYTDICDIMAESGIAGVNLSCGYYKQHTLDEYVNIEEMENNIKRVFHLIARECDKTWDYEEDYNYNYGFGSDYGYGYGYESYDYDYFENTITNYITPDKHIYPSEQLERIEFAYHTSLGTLRFDYGVGITATACLGDFLMKHPGITVSDICMAWIEDEPTEEGTENKENEGEEDNDEERENA